MEAEISLDSKSLSSISLSPEPACSPSDGELIERFRAGCHHSFEKLICRYEGEVFYLAKLMTKSSQDAEEVLAQVFVKLRQNLDNEVVNLSQGTYLVQLTARIALDYSTDKAHISQDMIASPFSPSDMEEEKPDAASLEEPFPGREHAHTRQLAFTKALESAITLLPEEYKIMFILRDVKNLNLVEIAALLSLPVIEVRTRLQRARLMLRRILLRYRSEDEELLSLSNGLHPDKTFVHGMFGAE